MQSQTLRQAKIRFLCPHMIFPKFSQNLIFLDISSIYDEKEALKYISTMSQASLGLNPSFLDQSFELYWCLDTMSTHDIDSISENYVRGCKIL